MKKGKTIIVCFIIMALMTACGKTANSQDNNANSTNDTKTETTKNEDKAKQDETNQTDTADDDEQEGENQQQNSDNAQTTQTGINIKVYCSNADASGFDTKEVAIQSLSSEEVLNALVGQGVLPVDVSVLSFKEFKKDGEEVLDLDFSEEFNTYMKSLGSSSEYYIVGSICNTFLDAYGCDKVHITVDGEVFATGHAEYPGYMGKFN